MRRYLRKYLPDHETIRNNPWLRPFESSLLHPRLWHLNRHSAAGAVAAGLFCGLIPGPLQMLGAAISAVAFKVNLPLALLVTLYTNPFTIVPLYLLAYQIGRLTIGESNGFLAPPVSTRPISSAGRKACSSGCWLSPSRSVLVCFCWPAGWPWQAISPRGRRGEPG